MFRGVQNKFLLKYNTYYVLVILFFFVTGTSSDTIFVSRRHLLDIMRQSGGSGMDEQFKRLTEEIKKRTTCDEKHLKELKQKLSHFKSEYRSRWLKACRIEEKFQKSNKQWLDTSISFAKSSQKKCGRPRIPFELCSARTKRQKTKELRDSVPLPMLTYATQISLRTAGNIQASKSLKELTKSETVISQKIQKNRLEKELRMSGEDALAMLVDAKLSRQQYEIIRRSVPEKFPSYKIVQAAKKPCYPTDIQVNDMCAVVPLQSLLNHTVGRLLSTLKPVLVSLQKEKLTSLCLKSKWGFDGSSGHSSYKQKFLNSKHSDSAVFITCLVPLQLICEENILWQNPRPASTRYCRPLKIEFIKESTEVCINEKNRIEQQIKQLKNSNVLIEDMQLEVSHNLILAMVDGKVCNAITETMSTQRCFICGATAKQFNNIDEMISRSVNTENLGFGLSVLHGWIRMFECLLHVSYKLPIKKWIVRESDKAVVLQNKARIQKMFRERCGLIVDKPKPGFGSSNDGNTARRFFSDPELTAEITNIDINLIKRIHIILMVVASGYEIDVEKFRQFSHNTARLFVEKYSWYNMPPTVHKYFIHGPEIISSAILPIGQLTEESQEACNKEFKMYREHKARKCSREKTNADIFNHFLLNSDPVINSKRKLPKRKLQHFPKEALDLLKSPTVPVRTYDHDDNDDSNEESEEETEEESDDEETDYSDDVLPNFSSSVNI